MTGDDRNRILKRTALTGIISNAFIAACKLVIGLFSGSVAIVSDAANNASDMLSSVVGVRKGRKCVFKVGIAEINLENEGKYPKAKAILTVIFETKDLALSMAVDNLFKVLS